jgi:hypothetical protein
MVGIKPTEAGRLWCISRRPAGYAVPGGDPNDEVDCPSMTGFKSFANAAITIAGIELAHCVRKRRCSFGRGRRRRGWSRKDEWAMALA